WLSGAWHYLALVAIAAGWTLWAIAIGDAGDRLYLLLGTLAIIVAARFAAMIVLGLLDRLMRAATDREPRRHGAAARAARYRAASRWIAAALIVGATALVLLQLWGARPFVWF